MTDNRSAATPVPQPPWEDEYGFVNKLSDHQIAFHPLTLETLQLNITKLCNQACVHCHVNASPKRREMMSDSVLQRVYQILAESKDINTVDITGGAPELHPKFRELVTTAKNLGKHVMVRHNLTVTFDPHPQTGEAMTDLPQFFADHDVEVVSSLPYYQEYFTDKQRGSGVFQKSIRGLQQLNELGYGQPETNRRLNLVYNPIGAFLPPEQESLTKTYHNELWQRFGIRFNDLYVITNMPIHRFKAQLKQLKTYEEYMEKLVGAFNPSAAKGVMCRNMISVDHTGRLFDCDFNQMLDMGVTDKERGQELTLFDWDPTVLLNRHIRVADHCYGCTAGGGSSCGGSTAD
jgi:radical SAM/Cys-rich protein